MLAETCRNIGVFVFFFKVQKRRENAFFARQVLCPSATLLQPPAWAAQYNTWILIKLTPKGIVFALLFFSFLFFSFLFFSFLFFSFSFLTIASVADLWQCVAGVFFKHTGSKQSKEGVGVKGA